MRSRLATVRAWCTLRMVHRPARILLALLFLAWVLELLRQWTQP